MIGNNFSDTFFSPLNTQSTSSKTDELTVSLSLAERWTTTEICRQLNYVPDEFPAHKRPTSFYKVFFLLLLFFFYVTNIVLVVKTEND